MKQLQNGRTAVSSSKEPVFLCGLVEFFQMNVKTEVLWPHQLQMSMSNPMEAF